MWTVSIQFLCYLELILFNKIYKHQYHKLFCVSTLGDEMSRQEVDSRRDTVAVMGVRVSMG